MLRWKMLLPIISAIVALGLCTCNSAFFDVVAAPVATLPPTSTATAAVPSSTASPTASPSLSPTASPTATPSLTATPTASATATPTPSQTPTATPVPPTATATNLPPPPNRPPVVTRFVSRFVPEQFTTFYEVFVTDPDGDKLSFTWSNSNPCGQFTWSADQPRAQWLHPDPLCPHDQPVHPGSIKVVIDDHRGGVVSCVYPGGSAIGALSKC